MVERRRSKTYDLSAEDQLVSLPDWRSLRGYEAVFAQWQELIARQALPQILLLHGRAGLGKTHLLAGLAAALLCAEGRACGVCASCRQVLQGVHPELLWLESSSGKFLLEDAARLQEHLALAAPGGARIAVLADADQLSAAAANRLLKLLEEPPPRACVLLSTSRLGGMLDTVLSRCVKWRIAPPPLALTRGLVEECLQRLGLQERPGLSAEIVQRAGLSPGLALQLCARVAAGEDMGAVSTVAQLLGTPDPAQALQLAEVLGRSARSDTLAVTAMLQECEIELNRAYRANLAAATRPSGNPVALAARRQVLRAAKVLAVQGQVPLNAQLNAEGLALSGLL